MTSSDHWPTSWACSTEPECEPSNAEERLPDLPALAIRTGSPDGEEDGGGHAVSGQVALHVRGGGIAGRAGIDHHGAAAGAAGMRAADRPADPPPTITTS